GVGAAASEPGTLSIIRQVFDNRHERARALSVWAAVSGVALAFGPIIGGILVSAGGWQQVFTFSLGLGVLVLVAGFLVLPESSDRHGRKLDFVGLVTGGLALAAATFGIILGESHNYTAWWVILLLAASLVLGLIFVLAERHHKDPVLPIGLFKNPAFTGANIVAFVTNFGVFAVFFFTALYLQIVAGLSGYKIALDFIAMAVVLVLAALTTGRWTARRGPLIPTVLGCLLAGIGMILVDLVLAPVTVEWQLVLALVLVGLGFGMTLTTMTTTVLNITPSARSGMAASTVNTFREMGGIFSVAILGAIVNAQLTGHLAARLQALGLPVSFQSLAIYAIKHGGNLPANAHISAGAILNHPALVTQTTNAAYAAFGDGLDIALYTAGALLIVTAGISWLSMRRYKPATSAI
ncbi:MAG: MFS transporter, partial [Candidatus Saccharimonadales bacterium]